MASHYRENLRTHARLTRTFLEHQVALLDGNWSRARKAFAQYERDLLEHMRHEERNLIPVYIRNGEAPNAPAAFFTGEHKRMREFLRRIKARLSWLEKIARDRSHEKRVELFDLEAAYKNLVQHHDQREKSKLYPALDRAAKKG